MAAHGEVWRPSVGNSVAACGEIPMAAVMPVGPISGVVRRQLDLLNRAITNHAK